MDLVVGKTTRNFEIRLALEKVLKQLEVIDAKLSGMPQVQVQVSSRFLPTLNALTNLGCGTASQVSRVTGRSRAFESKNLNELYVIGLLEKEVQGRMKIFKNKGGQEVCA
ncbi:MAG: hypothetical protein CW716_02805 [Candidatus Bathyarchaeum sp.]|nr:MAG: hypothetical protein CW716_02805 [Candidatus Bathyarchaeum sp.]